MPEEDLVELKFRLFDGSDIGPIRYSSSSTVAMLKERIISEWPRDKKIIPKLASDIKLISAGKILESNKTIAQCRPSFGELPGGSITMHVVVQPSSTKAKMDKVDKLPKKTPCSCSIKELLMLVMSSNSTLPDCHWFWWGKLENVNHLCVML